MKCRMIGDPPGPGESKLRIKSDGTFPGTRVLVVDSAGVERELIGVLAVGWKVDCKDDLARAELEVCDADVELDVEAGVVAPPGTIGGES